MIGRFQISTEHPTAKDSMDTIHPKGTSMDNSFNVNFNLRVMKLFREMRGRPRISVLDLGCAGGGMVESFIAMGQEAVGIQGSDYSLVHKRAVGIGGGTCSRRTRPKPFTVHRGDFVPAQFDLVTAWEFFEHIALKIQNIRRHIKPDGLVMLTTTDLPSRPRRDRVAHDPEA